MQKTRRDRLDRALRLYRQTWRIEMMRLAQLEATLTETVQAERNLLLRLDRIGERLSRDPNDPKLLFERLARLARRRQVEQHARDEQLTVTLEHGRRVKQSERIYARADQEWLREEARHALKQLSARFANPDDVSAP